MWEEHVQEQNDLKYTVLAIYLAFCKANMYK